GSRLAQHRAAADRPDLQGRESRSPLPDCPRPPLPEEADYLRENNEDLAFVCVSEEKLKVLYIEGLPRWDFRFLKNAMKRDHGLGGFAAKEPDIVLEREWRRLADPARA